MNRDGFYEGLNCNGCGKPLRGQGSGYPAESYAGTYTGLCYGCTDAPARHVETDETGAEIWEHPPPLPSWRRDRVRYRGYKDCARCKGRGALPGRNWRRTRDCDTCWERYLRNPIIVEKEAVRRRERARHHLVYQVANRLHKEHGETIRDVIEASRGCWNLPGPIRWPAGWAPTKAELKKTQKLFPGVEL